MNDLTRRTFLKRALGTFGTLGAFPVLVPRFVLAQGIEGALHKNYIHIFLSGGMDGLMACPYYQGDLVDTINNTFRPTLRVLPHDVIPFDDVQNGLPRRIGLNSLLQPLHNFAPNNIAIIQRYGIVQNPGRSHATCQTLLSLGRQTLGGEAQRGWLARLMDLQGWNTYQYWGIGVAARRPDFQAANVRPIILGSLDNFNFLNRNFGGSGTNERTNDSRYVRDLTDAMRANSAPGSLVATQLKNGFDTVSNSVDFVVTEIASQIVTDIDDADPDKYASTAFGRNIRDLAKVIKFKAGSPTYREKITVGRIDIGGLDTHSEQGTVLPGILRDMARNVRVFLRDLQSIPVNAGTAWDHTVVSFTSEFGRTNYENGIEGDPQVGTDHGYGSNTFMIGKDVRRVVIGTAPTPEEMLSSESRNALIPTIDYRNIFADVLQHFLRLPNWEAVIAPGDDGFTRQSLGLFAV